MSDSEFTVGILAAARPRRDLLAKFGSYAGMFRTLLSEPKLDSKPLKYRTFNVFDDEFPEYSAQCDGYVTTGSQASVLDDLPWIRRMEELVVELHEQRRKMVGICFGHQMIAQALDGRTERCDRGWGVGVHEYRITHQHPFMVPGSVRLRMLCSHQDQVTRVPSGARVFATSEFCPTAGMTLGEHFLSIQGHPEFTADYALELMHIRGESLGAAYQHGMETVHDPTDSKLFAHWMVRFLLD